MGLFIFLICDICNHAASVLFCCLWRARLLVCRALSSCLIFFFALHLFTLRLISPFTLPGDGVRSPN